ncbi:C40 family peptidase [Streptomyces alkaliterrae]|nr:C40 family peptidase [Streptomyces alkaliterrae]
MPTLGDLVSQGADEAVYATQSIAVQYELRAEQAEAAGKARKAAAKTAKVAAEKERKAAEAAAERARQAAEKRAAEARAAEARAADTRASRSTQRTLPGTSTATAPTTQAPASAATGSAAAVAAFARAQVGKPYVLGATGPNAYDCSGLTTAALRQVGVSLPRTSQAQSSAGTEVGLGNLRPGDILYWGGKGSATHVAIYVGDGKYVGAQNPRAGVGLYNMGWGGTPSGAVRFV